MLADGMYRTQISFAPQLEDDPALCNGRIMQSPNYKRGEMFKKGRNKGHNLDIPKPGAQSDIKYSLLVFTKSVDSTFRAF